MQERYCSQECAVEYATCRNCGRYYRAGSGYGGWYCGRECAVRYQLQRLAGARPVSGIPPGPGFAPEEHT